MFEPMSDERFDEMVAGSQPSQRLLLEEMSELDLRTLRERINELLPEDTLKNLNLEEELVGQYRLMKGLMVAVVSDMDVASNQKAQVSNSIVTALGQLVRMQEDLRREQTLLIMESTLIEVLKTLPEAKQKAFFAEYERAAKKAGLA